MNTIVVDLAELYCLGRIVGEKPPQSLFPVPVLFCFSEQQEDTSNIFEYTLHTLGVGYLTPQLIEYPFIIENRVGEHVFRSQSRDAVYCYPFNLLDERLVDKYIVNLIRRSTGENLGAQTMTGQELTSMRGTLADEYVVVSLPALFHTKRLHDVRYKIDAGRIYENKGNFAWKRTFPYDIMDQNA